MTKILAYCRLGMLLALCAAAPVLAGEAEKGTPPAPDYGREASWSRAPKSPDKPIDVFFMHPTTYGTMQFGFNAPIDDPAINAVTDGTVQSQASVFQENCNVYAPRYRQMSIEVLGMDETSRDKYLAIAEADMLRAFTYYLERYNQGRPFILAAHSQGSNVVKRFLADHRDLVPDDRLVAAYLIGWTFTGDDLKRLRLPLAETPEQTGALITWNTIGNGGKSPVLLPGALCVNPLTFTAAPGEAPASLNSYALIDLKDGSIVKKPHFTSARINAEGGLEIPTPAIEGDLEMGMGKAVYHHYDYAFFYGNLVENVAARCKAWLERR